MIVHIQASKNTSTTTNPEDDFVIIAKVAELKEFLESKNYQMRNIWVNTQLPKRVAFFRQIITSPLAFLCDCSEYHL